MYAACYIIAAYFQRKLKLFQIQGIIRPLLAIRTYIILDTVCCIFVTVTFTFYVFVEYSSKELQLKYSLSLYSKRSNFFTLQLEKELREAQDGIYLKLGRTSDKKDEDKKYV